MSYGIDLDPYVRCLQADLYQSCSDCRMHTNTHIGPNGYCLPYIYAAPAVDAGGWGWWGWWWKSLILILASVDNKPCRLGQPFSSNRKFEENGFSSNRKFEENG